MNPLTDQPFSEFLDDLASRTPTPGGGSVAPCVGALAGALAHMSFAYSIRKKTPDETKKTLGGLLAKLDMKMQALIDAVAEDMEAYGRLNELQRLDPGDPRREDEWHDTLQAAIAVPMSVMETGSKMLDLLHEHAPLCHRWLRSDLAIAAVLAEATIRTAAWNVRINLVLLEDQGVRSSFESRLAEMIESARARTAATEKACAPPDGE